jgi:hypothetical protein
MTGQDTSSLYGNMNISRQSGQGLAAVNSYYAGVYNVLVAAFNIHRPAGDPPTTFGEQTFVAAVLDRLLPMQRATGPGVLVEKDSGVPPTAHWEGGPGDSLFLTDAYFLLTNDRARVEHLLRLIIKANVQISVPLEPAYEQYIKENIRVNRRNVP